MDAASFGGTVRIAIDISEATSTIVLNALELKLTAANVSVGDGARQDLEWSVDEDLERVTLRAGAELPVGRAQLNVAFDGILNDKLSGFYRSTFVDDSGVPHTIATTQFESTNARRAFPCWDEPEFKATFDVTLVVPDNLLAISSGPEVRRESLDGGLAKIRFGTTMKMSTYLLAFVVGPLEATEAIDVDGTPMRVVHPPGKGHLTEFAERVGEFSLRHFADYFDIPYPGQKLDLVALPDFAFGAMENLGCITFREALLLLDESVSTQPEQQRAADVIAHEIAHMWFGDLVTMKWWNGIWLKEAFATFCEMHATNAMRPDWLRWDDFNLSRTAAFDTDSLAATRPIEFDVVSPEDAEAMYDVLTYEKGAAVVRMLEQFLGEDEFRSGIRKYLKEHAYSNTETSDLWDAIEGATGQPARPIMDSWIFQGGYPLVTIERLGPTSVRLRQQRFVYSDNPSDAQWSVPVVLGVGSGGEQRHHRVLLDSRELDVELGAFDWVIGNAEASGFYRVEHDAALMPPVEQISGVERYGLIDDAWAALLADRTGIDDVWDLVAAIAVIEKDTAVWRRIVGVIRALDHHLAGDARQRQRDASLALLAGPHAGLGPASQAGESEQTGELRAALFQAAGLLGDTDALTRARELLTSESNAAISAAAVRIVAGSGGAEDFEAFVQGYQTSSDPQLERRYLLALPRFRGDAEIQRLLAMLDADEIRSQDGATVLGLALANDAAASRVWDFIASNWDDITAKYPDNSIPRMISGAQSVGDAALAGAIETFFQTHEVPQAGQSLHQHLERMRVSVALRKRLRSRS